MRKIILILLALLLAAPVSAQVVRVPARSGTASQTPWTANVNADTYVLFGDNAANGDLTLRATSDATATSAYIILGDAGTAGVGIGIAAPLAAFHNAFNGAASIPGSLLSGTWYAGGSATTTKPYLLIEPTGTQSTTWSTLGTGLGINAPAGFAGPIIDVQGGAMGSGYSLFRVVSTADGGRIDIGAASTVAGYHSIGRHAQGNLLFEAFQNNQTTGYIFKIGPGVGYAGSGFNITNNSNTSLLFASSINGNVGTGTTIPRYKNTTIGVLSSLLSDDATNYEGLTITPSAGAVTFAAVTAGTGTDNVNIVLTPAGTGTVSTGAGFAAASFSVGATAGCSGTPTVSTLGIATTCTGPEAAPDVLLGHITTLQLELNSLKQQMAALRPLSQ